jgi:hypothetical protein
MGDADEWEAINRVPMCMILAVYVYAFRTAFKEPVYLVWGGVLFHG